MRSRSCLLPLFSSLRVTVLNSFGRDGTLGLPSYSLRNVLILGVCSSPSLQEEESCLQVWILLVMLSTYLCWRFAGNIFSSAHDQTRLLGFSPPSFLLAQKRKRIGNDSEPLGPARSRARSGRCPFFRAGYREDLVNFPLFFSL